MIARSGRHETEVRKSRFICSADRAASEADARSFVESIRREFWDANHQCVARVIGERGRLQRSNDDGEPAGTAGAPMLSVLRRRQLTDTVVVVTRYFGGIKLEAGGLIRAYGQAVAEALDNIGTVERRTLSGVSVRIGHDGAGRFEHAIRSADHALPNVTYDACDVTFTLTMEPADLPEFRAWVAQQSNGQASVVIGNSVSVEIPIDENRRSEIPIS